MLVYISISRVFNQVLSRNRGIIFAFFIVGFRVLGRIPRVGRSFGKKRGHRGP
jgi:hypothetical protein